MTERADASFTLREIAKRLGVSHTAAYRHFSSKGALLAEIARQGFELLTGALRATLAGGKAPARVLEQQAIAYVRTAVLYPAHFRCMFGPRRFDDEEAAPVDEACERSYACLTEAAAAHLGAGDDGEDVEALSLALWSLVHGLASLAIDGQLDEWAPRASLAEYERLAHGVAARFVRGPGR